MTRASIVAIILFPILSFAQPNWQQEISYKMEFDLDDSNHQFTGTQDLVYINNSPDELSHLYFHLYFNAFQPGSMMDTWSLRVEDPDPRVEDRISKLSPEEEGHLHVSRLICNGAAAEITEEGTILEVKLANPIKPGKKAKISMDFYGQVPVQIRRSGRDNKEGVAYSMAQWYPKMSEYDHMGWHADPYIGREFHGVWGDFDVTIHIDSAYTIGATGVLQNPKEIGHGYLAAGEKLKRPEGSKLSWNFQAENVHDFVWAADKDYVHTTFKTESSPELHFLYKNEEGLKENWEALPAYTARIFEYASEHYGVYPWPVYSVIQGGDGGMEYPMATLITGQRKFGSLVGVTVHEVMHSWYQGALANNEGLYSWMDEGFTQFSSNQVMNYLFDTEEDSRIGRYYDSYYRLAASGKEEPMSQMADHYRTFFGYGAAVYGKGAVFMAQLGYVIGNDEMQAGLKQYFEDWKMKHPGPNDVIRVMEKESGIHLKWYLHYMLNTTAQIDYAIESAEASEGGTTINLKNEGTFPMPIDLFISYKDGSAEIVNIPLRIMRGSKAPENDLPYSVAVDWPWTNETYQLKIDRKLEDIAVIVIDPTGRMADVNQENNFIDYTESE